MSENWAGALSALPSSLNTLYINLFTGRLPSSVNIYRAHNSQRSVHWTLPSVACCTLNSFVTALKYHLQCNVVIHWVMCFVLLILLLCSHMHLGNLYRFLPNLDAFLVFGSISGRKVCHLIFGITAWALMCRRGYDTALFQWGMHQCLLQTNGICMLGFEQLLEQPIFVISYANNSTHELRKMYVRLVVCKAWNRQQWMHRMKKTWMYDGRQWRTMDLIKFGLVFLEVKNGGKLTESWGACRLFETSNRRFILSH